MEQISRRDFIAVTVSGSEIDKLMPKTMGDIRDQLYNRGLISESAAAGHDICRAYNKHDVNRLRMIIRYEYADEMIKVSGV